MEKKILGYGELLLRLSPLSHGELLEQSGALNMDFAGAEANIIADLAIWGNETGFISAFPQNPVGRAANQFLRAKGVDTSTVQWEGERMGTYFIEHGSSIRGTRVTYDRKASSFTTTQLGKGFWEKELASAAVLVITGVTPALGKVCRENLKIALETARELGVKVMFDLNYRRALWGIDEARKSFEQILPFVDILIGNIGSAYDVFGVVVPAIESFDDLKKATEFSAGELEKRGDFEMLGMTLRLQTSASDNVLGGYFKKDGKAFFSQQIPTQIVDRLGGGDAFAAGLLHGLLRNWDTQKTVDFATAAFAITQTQTGDVNFIPQAELLSIASGDLRGFVKR